MQSDFGALASRLRAVREGRGIGLIELAHLSGLGLQTIIAIESGVYRDPTPAELLALSRALRIEPAHLTGHAA